VVFRFLNAFMTGAVGTAIKGSIGFNAMTDDFATAVITNGSQLVNRTLKTVERVPRTSRHDLKGQVIIVPTDFTFRHRKYSSYQ
jgi:hypothetical protein